MRKGLHGRNNGELCPVFSFSLHCSKPCAPSLLLSERSLPKLSVKMSTNPKLSVLGLYCYRRVNLPQILLPAERTSEVNPLCRNCDWLKNWRVNAVYFQVSLHSAWRVLVYTLVDAHITTWCLEKKKTLRKPSNIMRFISYPCSINSQCAEFSSPAVVQGYLM